MKALAKRLSQIVPSASMAMAQKAQQVDVDRPIIDLTLGQPDFDTPEHIKKAAYEAINEGKNSYTTSYGILELRKAIVNFQASRYGAVYDYRDEVLVTPGAKQGLMYLIQAIVDPGDEVVLFEPCWLSYRDMILLNGGIPRFIPSLKNLVPDLHSLEQTIGPKTKVILINNPVNPTGYIFNKEELEYIAETAERHDLYIIVDEIYDRIVFTRFTSMSELKNIRDRLVVVNGFSKAYAMTGWRIGYLLGPAEILSKVGLIHQHTATCAAAPSQYAAVAALTGNQNCVEAMRETYEKRSNLLYNSLEDSPFRLIKPDGTFYAMLDLSGFDASSSEKAEKFLLAYGIATVTGISYGVSSKEYVRLSLTVDEEKLKQAATRIKDSVS